MDTTRDALKLIANNLDKKVLLMSVAEEATELAQAAIKLSRFYDGTNPTGNDILDLIYDLREEYTDLVIAIQAYNNTTKIDNSIELDIDIYHDKIARWASRLIQSEKEKA